MRRLAIAAAVVATVAAVIRRRRARPQGLPGTAARLRRPLRPYLEGDTQAASSEEPGDRQPDTIRSGPHVPRRRRPAGRRSFPSSTSPARIRRPDRLARAARLPRGDAARRLHHWRSGGPRPAHPSSSGSTTATRASGDGGTDPGGHGWPGVLTSRSGTRRTLGARPRPGPAADRGRLGARRPHADPSRPDEDRAAELKRRWPARARRSAKLSTTRLTSSVTRRAGSTTRSSRACERRGTSGRRRPRPGLATPADMFRLERVRVDRSDGVAGLVAKLHARGA